MPAIFGQTVLHLGRDGLEILARYNPLFCKQFKRLGKHLVVYAHEFPLQFAEAFGAFAECPND